MGVPITGAACTRVVSLLMSYRYALGPSKKLFLIVIPNNLWTQLHPSVIGKILSRNFFSNSCPCLPIPDDMQTFTYGSSSIPPRSNLILPPIKGTDAKNDIEGALRYASYHHRNQSYGPHPFSFHLREVMKQARHLGFDSPVHLTVGALHDIVEDTDITVAELKARYGCRVAEAVSQLTRQPGESPAQYIGHMGPTAFAIKLADRFANLSAIGTYPNQLLKDRLRRLPKYNSEMAALRRQAYRYGPAFVQSLAVVEAEFAAACNRACFSTTAL